MTDLTVLVSPIPLYPETRDFTFGRRPKTPNTRPIMVTLETEIEEADRAQNSPLDTPIDTDFTNPPTSHPRHSRIPIVVEPHLLSPPVNTWKSRPRHRPTRSHSAPPERRAPIPVTEEPPEREPVRFNTEALGFRQRNPNRSFTSFSTVDRNTTRGGELVRPPPPLRETESLMDDDWKSSYPSFSTSVPVVISTVAKRQAGVNTLTAATSTSLTYDYLWSFPSADVSPVTTTVTTTSVIPIYISLLSTIPTTSDSNASPTESSSTISQPDSSVLGTSSSQSSALPSAALNVTKSSFNPIDLVPAFGVVGLFLIGLGIWVLYGCCTRKPRVIKDDGELITGPPYNGLHDFDTRRDVEEWGQDEDMISVHKYGQINADAQYRWPSYSEQPVFDPKTGFHVPNHDPKDDDEDTTLLSVSLVAPGRSISTRVLQSSSSARRVPPAGSSHHGHDAVSRQHSSATSAALHELYESDSEEDARRRAREPPWESLRHKSIKRGILDQVKKESTWMDSVRSSLMGVGTSAGPKRRRSENGDEGEEMRMRGEADARVSPDNARNGIGRRRGHVRANSDIRVGDSHSATARETTAPEIGRAEETIAMSERTRRQHHFHHPQAMAADACTRNSTDIVTPPPKLARGRRSYAWLKDTESEDRYTPLPARVNSSRSRSRSRSRSKSTSPIKHLTPRPRSRTTTRPIGSNATHPLPLDGGREREVSATVRALEILPQSPPQIMSPPLESQICFTPIPPLVPSSKNATAAAVSASRSSSRSDSAKPTRIPSPKKKKSAGKKTRDNSRSRSRQRSTAHSIDSPPGFPLSVNESAGTIPVNKFSASASTTRDASRVSRRRQKTSTKSEPERISLAPSGKRILSPQLARLEMPRDETGTESIMQKVDHIMEVGWNERDLGSEGIRSLSPTGFGRDV